jgi:hypothetical protein
MLDALFPTHKQETGPAPHTAWAAKIAGAPDDDRVEVTLDNFDRKLRFGPCAFMPIDGETPARGDRALVVFDENNDPWVACWIPG